MKKYSLPIFLIAVIVIFLLSFQKDAKKKKPDIVLPTNGKKSIDSALASTGLFVPYWTVSSEPFSSRQFNSLIYFGIIPNKNGIDMEDLGYKNIGKFIENASKAQEKILALRMVDSGFNYSLLKDKKLQAKIINQTISIAQKDSFNAVLLDLEISGFPFGSVVEDTNNFDRDFYQASKKDKLKFYITLSGDVFYRIKPYDVSFLAQHSDRIFVMAYDFNKANGDPGPNFPLEGQDRYGYDFKTMINDFLNIIPKDKINIVFGMFGYDWTISNGSSVGQAKALTLAAIKKEFIKDCNFAKCIAKRDSRSFEMNVHYTDSDGKNHVVWFEDEASVAKKEEFLKSKGILSKSYWAYSYF